jgi:hypothetical protein
VARIREFVQKKETVGVQIFTLISFPFLRYIFQKLEKITPVILHTLDFTVNILPKIQYWISASNIVVGLCLLTMGYIRWSTNKLSSEIANDVDKKMRKVKKKNQKIIEPLK